MTVTVTSLDQYKSKISYGSSDNDAAVAAGVDVALLGKNWTVYDASANTSGYQAAAFNSTLSGAGATGLVNGATAYTATITVDGVAKPISVVGSAAQTFTTLVSEINTDLGASAVASLVANTILVTSATTGLTSTVVMADGTGAHPLFAALTGFARFNSSYTGTIGKTYTNSISGGAESGYDEINVGSNKIGASATGFLNTAALYKATVTVDGIAYLMSFAGSTAQTFTTFLSGLNTVLGVHATAALVNGNVRITSASTGAISTVTVVDTPAAGSQVVNVGGAKTGASPTGLTNDATSYTATVTIDGVGYPVTVAGSAAQTYTALLSAIATAIGVHGSVAIVSGNIKVTSATTGVASSVAIADTGANHLFASLTGFVAIVAAVAGVGSAFASLTGFVAIGTPVNGTGGSNAGGYQVIDVAAVQTASSSTGLSPDTAGYQEVLFVYQKLTTDYTALANNATAYTATITVDGVAIPVSIAGSAAQTFATLITALNSALGAAASAALTGGNEPNTGNLRITSSTTGAASSVSIVNTGTHPLFSSMVNFYQVNPAVAGTHPTYNFTVVVDGGAPQSITVTGTASQTFGTLVTAINATLTGALIALNGGNLRITSNTTGPTSSVNITIPGSLFDIPAVLASCNGVQRAIPGTSVTPVTEYYVVATVGNGMFSYQRYTTWNAGLHTGTGPGTKFGFNRNPAHAGAIYMYSGTSNNEALAFN
jgi:hypothetical protein